VESLSARATAAGIMAVALMPKEGDFNDDLCRLGLPSLAARLLPQLAPGHLARFAVETA
jgi:hypothetical protein